MRVPLASSGLRAEDIDSAIEVLRSGNLTMGSKVKAFESAVASYLGSKEFVMMNSGSSANLAIFEALLRPSLGEPKLSQGDGVLVPAIAWPTTIWPILQLGLRPIFVDIDMKTFGLDLELAQRAINTSKIPVKAIFPIHPLGRALSGQKLQDFATVNNLILVHDVCESLGSWQNGRHTGTNGLAASFSFYFSHHITTMEGGGVATNDSSFANDLRSIRSHGWSRDRADVEDWTKNVTNNDAKFLFVSAGYNVRPMEIQAAIGIGQIRDVDNFIIRRRAIAQRVNEALSDTHLHLVGSETLARPDLQKEHSWMLLPITCKGNNPIKMKHSVIAYLEEKGIETRPVLTGNFLDQPAMRKIYADSPDPRNFPNADAISATSFMVGAHHDLSEDQIAHLTAHLRSAGLQN